MNRSSSKDLELDDGKNFPDKSEYTSTNKSPRSDDPKSRNERAKEESIKDLWRKFFMETSCHGMRIIASSTTSRAVRVIYGLIVFAMLCSLHGTIIELSSQVMKYKTVTRTEIYVDHNMTFPSITLCNLCPFSFRGKNESDFLYTLLAKVSRYGVFMPELQFTKASFQQFLNRTAEDLFNEYSMGIGLLHAEYDGTKLNWSHFEAIDTMQGRCYQFNGPKHIKRHGAWRFTRMGRTSGLRVVIDIKQGDYGIVDDGTAGVKVYVSRSKESPPVNTHGLEIMPGTSTLVSIKTNKISFLASPFTSYGSEYCTNVDEDNPELLAKMVNASFYSYELCMEQCVSFKASQECSCYIPTLVIPGMKACTAYEFLFGCHMNASVRIGQNINSECDCPNPCSITMYDVTLSSSQFPSQASLKAALKFFNETDPGKIRDNILEVRAFFESPLVKLEKHDPEYTFHGFISSLGGQMGICLGASLITLIELFDIIICTAAIIIKRLGTRICRTK